MTRCEVLLCTVLILLALAILPGCTTYPKRGDLAPDQLHWLQEHLK